MENNFWRPNDEILKALDEIDINLEETRKKTRKRSSILKQPKASDEEQGENTRKSISSKRRVSFAEKFQVMELCTGNVYDVPGKSVSSDSVMSGDLNSALRLNISEKENISIPIAGHSTNMLATETYEMGNENISKKHKIISQGDLEPASKNVNPFDQSFFLDHGRDISDFKRYLFGNDEKDDCSENQEKMQFFKKDNMKGNMNLKHNLKEMSPNSVISEMLSHNEIGNFILSNYESTSLYPERKSISNILDKKDQSKNTFSLSQVDKMKLNPEDKYLNDSISKDISAIAVSPISVYDIALEENKENVLVDKRNKNILVARDLKLKGKKPLQASHFPNPHPLESAISNDQPSENFQRHFTDSNHYSSVPVRNEVFSHQKDKSLVYKTVMSQEDSLSKGVKIKLNPEDRFPKSNISKDTSAVEILPISVYDVALEENKENILVDKRNKNILVARDLKLKGTKPLQASHFPNPHPLESEISSNQPSENFQRHFIGSDHYSSVPVRNEVFSHLKDKSLVDKTVMSHYSMDLTCIPSSEDGNLEQSVDDSVPLPKNCFTGQSEKTQLDESHIMDLTCHLQNSYDCLSSSINNDFDLMQKNLDEVDMKMKELPQKYFTNQLEKTQLNKTHIMELTCNSQNSDDSVQHSVLNDVDLMQKVLNEADIKIKELPQKYFTNQLEKTQINKTHIMELTCKSQNPDDCIQRSGLNDEVDMRMEELPQKYFSNQLEKTRINKTHIMELTCKSQNSDDSVQHPALSDADLMQRHLNGADMKMKELPQEYFTNQLEKTQINKTHIMELTCISHNSDDSMQHSVLNDVDMMEKHFNKVDMKMKGLPQKYFPNQLEKTQLKKTHIMELTCNSQNSDDSMQHSVLNDIDLMEKHFNKVDMKMKGLPQKYFPNQLEKTQLKKTHIMELTCNSQNSDDSIIPHSIINGIDVKQNLDQTLSNLGKKYLNTNESSNIDDMDMTCNLPNPLEDSVLSQHSTSNKKFDENLEKTGFGKDFSKTKYFSSARMDFTCEVASTSESVMEKQFSSRMQRTCSLQDETNIDIQNTQNSVLFFNNDKKNDFDAVQDVDQEPNHLIQHQHTLESDISDQETSNNLIQHSYTSGSKIIDQEPSHHLIQLPASESGRVDQEPTKHLIQRPYASESDIVYAIKQVKGINQALSSDYNIFKFPEVYSSLKKSLRPKTSYSCSRIHLTKSVADAIRHSSSFSFARKTLSLVPECSEEESSNKTNESSKSFKTLTKQNKEACTPALQSDVPELTRSTSRCKTIKKSLFIEYCQSPRQNVSVTKDYYQSPDTMDYLRKSFSPVNETHPKLIISHVREESVIENTVHVEDALTDSSVFLNDFSISLVPNDITGDISNSNLMKNAEMSKCSSSLLKTGNAAQNLFANTSGLNHKPTAEKGKISNKFIEEISKESNEQKIEKESHKTSLVEQTLSSGQHSVKKIELKRKKHGIVNSFSAYQTEINQEEKSCSTFLKDNDALSTNNKQKRRKTSVTVDIAVENDVCDAVIQSSLNLSREKVENICENVLIEERTQKESNKHHSKKDAFIETSMQVNKILGNNINKEFHTPCSKKQDSAAVNVTADNAEIGNCALNESTRNDNKHTSSKPSEPRDQSCLPLVPNQINEVFNKQNLQIFDNMEKDLSPNEEDGCNKTSMSFNLEVPKNQNNLPSTPLTISSTLEHKKSLLEDQIVDVIMKENSSLNERVDSKTMYEPLKVLKETKNKIVSSIASPNLKQSSTERNQSLVTVKEKLLNEEDKNNEINMPFKLPEEQKNQHLLPSISSKIGESSKLEKESMLIATVVTSEMDVGDLHSKNCRDIEMEDANEVQDTASTATEDKKFLERYYKKLRVLRRKFVDASREETKKYDYWDCQWSFQEMDDEQAVFEVLGCSAVACYVVNADLEFISEEFCCTKISFKHKKEDPDEQDEIGFYLFQSLVSDEKETFPFPADKLLDRVLKYVNFALRARVLVIDVFCASIGNETSIDFSHPMPRLNVNILSRNTYSLFCLSFPINVKSYPNERIIPEVKHIDFLEIQNDIILTAVNEVQPGKSYISNMAKAAYAL